MDSPRGDWRRAGLTLALLAAAWQGSVAGNLAAVPALMTPIYMNSSIQYGMIDATRRSLQAQSDRRGAPPPRVAASTANTGMPAASRASYDVPADAAVSQMMAERYLDNVRRHYDPQSASTIAQTFADKPVRSAYREAAGPYGLSERDLRDVTTAWLVTSWMVVNQAPLPTRSQVQAVRTQLGDWFAGKPLNVDARQRQIEAEDMMYQLVSLIYARQEGEQAGDRDGLARLADATTRALQQQRNLDLRRMRLTDAGFGPR